MRVRIVSKELSESCLSLCFATEMMIMAGEAIGKWKLCLDREVEESTINSTPLGRRRNVLRLAFRSQPKPGEYDWTRLVPDVLLGGLMSNYRYYRNTCIRLSFTSQGKTNYG